MTAFAPSCLLPAGQQDLHRGTCKSDEDRPAGALPALTRLLQNVPSVPSCAAEQLKNYLLSACHSRRPPERKVAGPSSRPSPRGAGQGRAHTHRARPARAPGSQNAGDDLLSAGRGQSTDPAGRRREESSQGSGHAKVRDEETPSRGRRVPRTGRAGFAQACGRNERLIRQPNPRVGPETPPSAARRGRL